MPKLTFTPEELKGYFKYKERHHFYKDTVDKEYAMRVHADGLFPVKLIRERRPNEPEEVLKYRELIFESKTQPTVGKIISSLSKIRRSSDWSIRYDLDNFTRVAEGETLEDYCEKNLPTFESLTNWAFAVLLKEYLVDPNAVVLVIPMEVGVDENEYLKPFPRIFNSPDVLDFVEDDYVVLSNPLGATYYVRNKAQKGESYYIATTTHVLRFDQINSRGDLAVAVEYEHGLGVLPAFQLTGIVCKTDGNKFLYKSRIADILPELNEAIREYSDLQASKVMHIYPERWEITENDCPKCNGQAKIPNPNWVEGQPGTLPCDHPQCVSGKIPTGPYSKILVRLKTAIEGGGNIPLPPAGYVEKAVEIVKIQDQGVDKHIYSALAAINFQFLENTPLNQSGTAKEVDKDELNNTVHSIAEDIVKAMDNVYRLIAITRYKALYSPDEIEEMLPEVSVPEKYDMLSATHLEQSLTTAKTNKVNPVILTALEIEYASKKFNTSPEVRDRLMLILELDPLPNVSEDEKMSRLSNKGITQLSYVISSNIQEFVQRAIEENENFPSLSLKEKKDVLKKFGQEIIDEQDQAKAMVRQLQPDTGLNELNQEQQQPEPIAV